MRNVTENSYSAGINQSNQSSCGLHNLWVNPGVEILVNKNIRLENNAYITNKIEENCLLQFPYTALSTKRNG